MTQECAARISKLSKTLGKYEGRAEEFAKYAAEAVEAARNSGDTIDEQAVIDAAAKKFIADMTRKAELEKFHRALNFKVRQGFKESIKDKTPQQIVDSVNSIMIGMDGRGDFKGSVERKAVTLQHMAMSRYFRKLEEQGLSRYEAIRYLRKNLNAKEIVKASYDKDLDVPREARIIANAMEDTADFMRKQANRFGADIAKLPGYLFRQSHDRFRIHRAKRENWVKFIEPLLDEERTFGKKVTRDQKLEHLRKSWNTIVTGEKQTEMVGDLSAPPGFTGPKNMAKELSHSRNLHFKDGDAAYAYMQEFGYPDVANAFNGGLEMMSRNVAAMMHLGPNAKAMLTGKDGIVGIAKKAIGDDEDVINSFDLERLELEFDEVLGTNSVMPADGFGGMLARGSNWMRNILGSAVLGGVSLTSLSDIATSVARLGEFGVPLAEAHRDMLAGMFEGRRKDEMREIADSLGIGIEYLMDSASARLLGDGTGNGQGSSLISKVFEVTGMNWLSDTMKASAGLSLSNYIAKQTAKSFDDLTPAGRQELEAYGITKDIWPQLKEAVREVNGKQYIDARNIKDSDTQLLFQTFVNGFVDSAVLTPGARARITMRAGRNRGEVLSEMSMLFFHLKSYSITYVREILSRTVKGGTGGEKFVYAAHLMTSMIVYGTIVNMLKDISKGQIPQEVNRESIFRGFMTSGGLGFYGDLLNAFIFQEKKFGRSPAADIMGPVYGTFDKLILSPLNSAYHGEFERAGQEVYRGAKSMLPFSNLFYARLGLDYFIMWDMNEAIRPGSAAALEERMREEYGREYFVRPTIAVSN